jgi:hypothetical protein
MTDMKTKAQKIWNTYIEGYSEALCTPVEQFDTSINCYSRKIVAAVIRDISSELQYYNTGEGEDMIIDAQALYELADELEELE